MKKSKKLLLGIFLVLMGVVLFVVGLKTYSVSVVTGVPINSAIQPSPLPILSIFIGIILLILGIVLLLIRFIKWSSIG